MVETHNLVMSTILNHITGKFIQEKMVDMEMVVMRFFNHRPCLRRCIFGLTLLVICNLDIMMGVEIEILYLNQMKWFININGNAEVLDRYIIDKKIQTASSSSNGSFDHLFIDDLFC